MKQHIASVIFVTILSVMLLQPVPLHASTFSFIDELPHTTASAITSTSDSFIKGLILTSKPLASLGSFIQSLFGIDTQTPAINILPPPTIKKVIETPVTITQPSSQTITRIISEIPSSFEQRLKNIESSLASIRIQPSYNISRTEVMDLISGSLSHTSSSVGTSITNIYNTPLSDFTGILSIVKGGTGLSTTPTYGQLLMGNTDGSYSLVATSSLGLSAGVVSSQWSTLGANVYFTTGNVGIGTTSPFAKLSIHANNGETNTSLFTIASSTINSTSTLLTVANTGNVGIGTASPGNTLDVNGGITILNTQRVLFGVSASTGYLNIGTGGGYGFYTGSTDFFVRQWDGANYQNRLAISGSTGNVGVATTTPWALFSVNSTASIGTAPQFFVGSSTSPHLIVTNTGNIGVGTLSPSAKIHVNGGEIWQIYNAARNRFVFGEGTGGNQYGVLSWNSSDNRVALGTATYLDVINILDSNGYVGIGTSSPNSALTVQGDSGIILKNSDGTQALAITTSSNASNRNTAITLSGGVNSVNTNASSLFLGANSAAWGLTLASTGNYFTGNVGVGTTTPYGKLSVENGTAATVGLVIKGASSQTGNLQEWTNNAGTVMSKIDKDGQFIFVNGGANLTLSATGSGGVIYGYQSLSFSANNGDSSKGILVLASGGNNIAKITGSYNSSTGKGDSILFQGGSWGGNAVAGDVMFRGGVAGSGTAGTIRFQDPAGTLDYMKIDVTGNVGIGTTTPFAKLSVHAINGDTNAILFAVASSTTSATTTHFVVTNAGNVGIGTESPLAKLQISGSSATVRVNDGGVGNPGFEIYSGGVKNGSLTSNTSNGDTTLYSIGKLIFTSGNIGIGSTSPYANLSLQTSSASAIGLLIKATASQSGSIIETRSSAGASVLSFTTPSDTAPNLTITDPINGGSAIIDLKTGATTRLRLTGSGGSGGGEIFSAGLINIFPQGATQQSFRFDISNSIPRLHGGRNSSSGLGNDLIIAGGETNDFQAGSLLLRGGNPTNTGTAGNVKFQKSDGSVDYITVLNSNGFVGVGTTSPWAKLSVNNYSAGASTVPLFVIASSTGAGATSTAVFVSSTGNVGINTTNPTNTLDVTGNLRVTNTIYSLDQIDLNATLGMWSNNYNSNSAGGIRWTNGNEFYGTYDLGLARNSAGVLRVTNGSTGMGNLLVYSIGIGTTSPSYLLHVGSSTVSGIVSRFENSSGTCDINPTTTSLSCSSDIKLKKNITTLTAGTSLEKILALNSVTFNWNKELDSDTKHPGFIAQEIEPILPELVTTNPDGLKSVSYTNFIPYLVQAIQELQKQINEMKTNVANVGTSIGNSVGLFKEVRTEKLCVDDVCVTKQEFKNLLEKNGIGGGVTIPPIEPPTGTTTPPIDPDPGTTTPPTIDPIPESVPVPEPVVEVVAPATE